MASGEYLYRSVVPVHHYSQILVIRRAMCGRCTRPKNTYARQHHPY